MLPVNVNRYIKNTIQIFKDSEKQHILKAKWTLQEIRRFLQVQEVFISYIEIIRQYFLSFQISENLIMISRNWFNFFLIKIISDIRKSIFF